MMARSPTSQPPKMRGASRPASRTLLSSATAVMKRAGSNEAAAMRRLFAPGGGRARSSEGSLLSRGRRLAGDDPRDLSAGY